MPRPTPAQLIYGSVTVVLSALAMLLLSRTQSGPGVALIAFAATVLGVLVALSVPVARGSRRTPARRRAGAAKAGASHSPVRARSTAHVPVAPPAPSPAASPAAPQQPVAAPSPHR